MEVDTAWFVRSYAPALKARTIGMTIGLRCASFNTFIPNTGNRQPHGGRWRRRTNLNVRFGSQADLFTDITRMSASGGKAAIRQADFGSP